MPDNEKERIISLYRYNILDTPPDGSFDKMTQLASKIFNVPIAIISLVDTDRIWFKSKYGLDIQQINRDPGLCASAILSDDIYLVEDARNDPRTLTNPLVAGEFGLQFYAAAPLHTHDGYNLGTFCILDKKKRYFHTGQREILKGFAVLVMESLELRLIAHNTIAKLSDAKRRAAC
jgi:GAF domain-containing protein